MTGWAGVEAVLLDMDGTLVDSDASVERAWRIWADRYGVDEGRVLAGAHGHPAETTVRHLLPQLNDDQVAEAAGLQLRLQFDDVVNVTAARGARALLSALARCRLAWAVVTSADRSLAEARLRAAGICPPLLLTRDDVAQGKPHADGYLKAAAALGVPPSACLVVEDSTPGIAAGQAAGMRVVALRGLAADHSIVHLGQLADQLDTDAQPWWRRGFGYQVYLPSFQDSDGDGWGDLAGVASRLDYLTDLGVDIVWLTPFFVSPMVDHGYDIADYLRVGDRYGGDKALAHLLRQAHHRGLRVLADLVVNHTSDQHPWFQQARSARDDPYRAYYLWRDPAPDGGPPNNWLSHFGGPAWTRDDTSGQYYLHLFSPHQPDLNWRNPAVAEEIDAVIEHWLDRGIDGFRIDTAAYLIKHSELADNPLLPPGKASPVRGVANAWRLQHHAHDIHQPDVHDIHQRWRRIADRYGAFLVGEIYELDPPRLAKFITDERLHSSFWFGLVESDWDCARIKTMLKSAAATSAGLSWVQGNHDRSRAATRYGGAVTGRRRGLALHTLIAFLPGTPWLYQGEELGLEDGPVPSYLLADPLGQAEAGKSRDPARTPIPWSSAPNAGFTTGVPWLPITPVPHDGTVDVQSQATTSYLSAVRRLLHTRASLFAGHSQRLSAPLEWDIDGHDDPDVVVYRRHDITVIANLGDQAAYLRPFPGEVLFDTDPTPKSDEHHIHLKPQQAVVVRH